MDSLPTQSKPDTYSTSAGFLRVLRNVLFPLLMAVLAWFVLDRPDQSTELIHQITQKGQGLKFGFTILSFVIWSYLLLASGRMLLQVSPHGLSSTNGVQRLILWMPVMLSSLPYLIGIILLIRHQIDHDRLKWFCLTPVYQLGLVGVIHLTVAFRFVLKRKATIKTYFDISGTFTELKTLLMHTPGLTGMFWIAAIIISVLIIGFLPIPEWAKCVAPFVGSPFVFLAWVGVITFLGSLVVYFNDNRRRPTSLIAIALLFLSSSWADHSRLEVLTDSRKDIARPTLDAHLRQWISQRVRERQQVSIPDTLPLIIVAAEGGGIRAMDWAIEGLLAMDSLTGHQFNHYLYAISGVSGGGVGAAFYVANLHDQLAKSGGRLPALLDSVNLWKAASQDFLAPVLAGGLYWDGGLLKLFPTIGTYPWFADRTKWLAKSWGWQYADNHHTHTLDSSLTSLYDRQATYNTNLPSLFLNGTLAETGQKVITSNLQLVTNAERGTTPSKAMLVQDTTQFSDVVDVLATIKKPIALKMAATLCSRFPIVTNGAWLQEPTYNPTTKKTTITDIGHVTDGGYFDNSGIETALQLLNALQPAITNLQKPGLVIKPYILFLQNSQRPKAADEIDKAIHLLRGIREPIASLFNPWSRASLTRDNLYRRLIGERSVQTGYINISLNSILLPKKGVPKENTPQGESLHRYPLGWYMNPATIQAMRGEIKHAFEQLQPHDKDDLIQLRRQLHNR